LPEVIKIWKIFSLRKLGLTWKYMKYNNYGVMEGNKSTNSAIGLIKIKVKLVVWKMILGG
jgi:hypothetical protein